MARSSFFAARLAAILTTGLLALGCGDGKGGTNNTDGGPGTGGGSGGGSQGSGGMSGTGGMAVGGGKTSTGGSSGTGGSTATVCPAFDACGGPVVGTWKLPPDVICGDMTAGTTAPSSCPGYSATEDLQQSGTFTLSSSGAFNSTTVVKGTENFTYPLSCLGSLTCAELTTEMIASADPGATGSCVENTSNACACSFTFSQTTSQQGTYTTTGGKMTETTQGSISSPDTADYCVQGNTLMMHFTDPASGNSATYAYTRQ
jgi:hypothetical protein